VADDAAATAVAPATAGPGSRRGDRPELLVQISMVAVIVAVVAGAVVFSWFNRRLAIPDPTTWEPGRLVTATFDPPTNKVELFHNQGDGQFYVHMAQDPFLRQPERIQGGPSEQAYRLQRPLYGWVGWALTLGDAGRAAWVMVGLTVASVAALAAVVAALAARLGRSPMWGLAILGFPGIHVDLLRCGPEALGTALLGLALLALAPAWRVGPWGVDRHRLSSRRLVASLLCFALAGLTRESFLAVPVVLSAVWWWQTRARRSVSAGGWFRSWGWPLVSVVPFLVWVVVLRLALGAWSQGSGGGEELAGERMASVPFGGLVDALSAWRVGEALSLLLIVGPALLGVVRSRSLEWRSLIAVHVGLSATFGFVVWYTWVGFSRVLLPLSLVGLLAVLDHRAASPGPAPAAPDPPVSTRRG
jgi:hypothetical protein